ncbi:hypothetical protein HanIR_Chr11g0510471 [Helianthus annuus]|nr:hypothetical protein HanIR_Chr11g0510471 [Helianthus annuus]
MTWHHHVTLQPSVHSTTADVTITARIHTATTPSAARGGATTATRRSILLTVPPNRRLLPFHLSILG